MLYNTYFHNINNKKSDGKIDKIKEEKPNTNDIITEIESNAIENINQITKENEFKTNSPITAILIQNISINISNIINYSYIFYDIFCNY